MESLCANHVSWWLVLFVPSCDPAITSNFNLCLLECHAGPVSSFLVISDPAAAKHVLRATDNNNRNIYNKGLVAEVSQFLFGDGFAVAGGEHWRSRRRAVSPSLHR